MAEKREKNTPEESKEPFLLPFENFIDPAAIIDNHGRFLGVTKAVEEITGFKRRELVGKKFFDVNIMTEESKSLLKKNFARRMAGEKIRPYEFEALTKDGTRIPAELNATLIEYKRKPAVLAVFRDVSERKRAEEVLRDSRDQYQELLRFNRQILEHSPVGILKLDEKLRITYENPAMRKILSVPPGEESNAIGTDIRELPSVKAAGAARMFNDLLKGKKISGNLPFKSTYGKKSFLSLSCSPIFDGVKFMGAVLIVSDITERKKAENRIKMEREVYRSIAHAANRSRTVEKLCELALKDIQRIIKYDMADVLVYRESENALVSAAQFGYPEDLYLRTIKRQDLKEESGVAAQAVRKRKSIYIDDVKTNKLTRYVHDLIVKYNISTLYVVPLFSRGKLQGVLEVLTLGDKKLSREDHEVLNTISEELAGGIAKAKIEERLVTAKEAFGWLTQG